jgi:hypothetical protein
MVLVVDDAATRGLPVMQRQMGGPVVGRGGEGGCHHNPIVAQAVGLEAALKKQIFSQRPLFKFSTVL